MTEGDGDDEEEEQIGEITTATAFLGNGEEGTPRSHMDLMVKLAVDLARTESNIASDFLELDERGAAEAAITRAREALTLHPQAEANRPMQGRLLHESASIKEHAGDAAAREGGNAVGSAGTKLAETLYLEAKNLYRASHSMHPDEATKASFMRVQVKAHPDMEFVQTGAGGRGIARSLRDGVQLESIDGPGGTGAAAPLAGGGGGSSKAGSRRTTSSRDETVNATYWY